MTDSPKPAALTNEQLTRAVELAMAIFCGQIAVDAFGQCCATERREKRARWRRNRRARDRALRAQAVRDLIKQYGVHWRICVYPTHTRVTANVEQR